MNNIEIFVKINDEWRLLDTYENETISLNYNLADNNIITLNSIQHNNRRILFIIIFHFVKITTKYVTF